jgi:hypothetical protein
MNTAKYHLSTLKEFFKKQKIATIEQVQAVLNNPARCTIFRKLGELEYLSSYSHRGKYYTLRSIARFSDQGLWRFQDVQFSCFGNLLDTAETFVQHSEAGYSAGELKDILCVKTKHALMHLSNIGRLYREQIGDLYIYFSPEAKINQRQKKARTAQSKSLVNLIVRNPDLAVEEAKAAILLFISMLDEKQRRLYAGLESLKLGYGGDAHIASLLGMDPHTVARGREELLSGDFDENRVRSIGGGRLPQEKKRLKSSP